MTIRCNLGVGCDEVSLCYARRIGKPEMCGCQDCGGCGEVFTHSPDCEDELCALNGDIHSCYGLVLQCECAIVPKDGASQ